MDRIGRIFVVVVAAAVTSGILGVAIASQRTQSSMDDLVFLRRDESDQELVAVEDDDDDPRYGPGTNTKNTVGTNDNTGTNDPDLRTNTRGVNKPDRGL